MNLLPKFHQEFAQKSYWNEFFKKRGSKAFEWYGEFFELQDIVYKYVRKSDNIIIVGCGNSELGMEMFDAGFKSIINIDISSIVISQMLDLNKKIREELKFLQMDATQMSFKDETFSVAFDKGTLDALFVNENPETCHTVERYMNEVTRVLRPGGRFLCVSLLQHHILNYLMDYFSRKPFMIRVVYCHAISISEDHDSMPVFVVVATKMKSMLNLMILEYSQSTDHTKRAETKEHLIDFVLSIQNAAFICKGLKRDNLPSSTGVKIELFNIDESELPRYTVYVVEQRPRRNLQKYAGFIVPQGRETDWMFSTDSGRRKLLDSVNFERLAIVLLHPDQEYKSIDNIKTELTECIQKLAPDGINHRIPFLSLGSDIGQRVSLFCGLSEISGKYRIEEIETETGQVLRRLIFLSNQFVVQSEAAIIKLNDGRKEIDLQQLACKHHVYMSMGAAITVQHRKSAGNKILVIGLGGGSLCSYLNSVLSNIVVTAVDIDPAIPKIAEEFFGLQPSNKLKVVICDGIEFLKRSADEGSLFNTVMLDVDSKNSNVGLSCPPREFLEMSTLLCIKNIIGLYGILILNVVCRQQELRSLIISDLQTVFSSLCSYKLEEDVNEIFFCTNKKQLKSKKEWSNAFQNSTKRINSLIKTKQNKLDTTDFLKNIEIL